MAAQRCQIGCLGCQQIDTPVAAPARQQPVRHLPRQRQLQQIGRELGDIGIELALEQTGPAKLALARQSGRQTRHAGAVQHDPGPESRLDQSRCPNRCSTAMHPPQSGALLDKRARAITPCLSARACLDMSPTWTGPGRPPPGASSTAAAERGVLGFFGMGSRSAGRRTTTTWLSLTAGPAMVTPSADLDVAAADLEA